MLTMGRFVKIVLTGTKPPVSSTRTTSDEGFVEYVTEGQSLPSRRRLPARGQSQHRDRTHRPSCPFDASSELTVPYAAASSGVCVMTCATCGRVNRQGAVVCAGCGSRLAPRCGDCDAELADGARFREIVRFAVGRRPLVAAARKVVTIMFADLSGSTAFQERLDAEATRRVMDRVHRALAEAVEGQQGRVVKFTGYA